MNNPPGRRPKPYTFDLETAIATWRQFLSRERSLGTEDLEELENHLREEIEELNAGEMTDEERFRLAVKRVGDMADIGADYGNVLWEKRLTPSRAPGEAAAAFSLFGSYLKTAWAGMVRHKGYALLNLTGLAVALAACIIIVLYVLHEFSYDRFHEKADRIYRVEMTQAGETSPTPRMPFALQPVGPALKSSIPEIEHVIRLIRSPDMIVQVGERQFVEDRFVFSEPEFFQIFDFALTAGLAEGLSAPHTVLLSESAASKYFPDSDPVGRRVLAGERSSAAPEEYEVIGTFADMPPNVHFRADFIASFRTIEDETAGREWQRLAYTYLSVHPEAVLPEIRSKTEAFWAEFVPQESGAGMSPILQPLNKIHLFGEITTNDIEPQGDITYVLIFILAAVLLLIVACVNYINLAVARFASRAREVGVRKVMGANRSQLVWQFLGESTLYCLVSFLLATSLASLALPILDGALDLELSLLSRLPTILIWFVPSLFFIALLAGGYPSLFLSRFAPSSVFRGLRRPGSQARFRKGLILFQFVITSCLVVATIVIWRQLRLAQDTKMGIESEQIVILPTSGALDEGGSAFRDALTGLSGVRSVSFAYNLPGRPGAIRSYGTGEIEAYHGDADWMRFDLNWVDTTFAQTLGLNLASGRFFSADRPGDLERGVVLNETAVRRIGWEEPLGKHLGEGDARKEVIGILRDFHTASMYEEIQPLVLEYREYTRFVALRASTSNLRQLMADLESVLTSFIPSRPFEYSFLDDDFKAMYRKETQLGRLFTAFSMLTILVAVLGLFGLVSFDAQQRTKEIGIRKSMGATASNITLLLSRRFFVLVLVSFFLSTPLIYWLMTEWLSRFAYRIELGPGLFALSGLIVLSVAMLTVGIQAVRTAITSPVECLRQE